MDSRQDGGSDFTPRRSMIAPGACRERSYRTLPYAEWWEAVFAKHLIYTSDGKSVYAHILPPLVRSLMYDATLSVKSVMGILEHAAACHWGL